MGVDKKMNEKRICGLCGNELTRKKGQSQKAHEYELQRGAHVLCLRTREGIMRKYSISGNDYLNAVVEGLFQLSPEIEETKSMKEYESRERKAEEEIEEQFPYLKELKEKKKGEKKQEVEKEEQGGKMKNV